MIITTQEPIAHLRAAAKSLRDVRRERVAATVGRLYRDGEQTDEAIEHVLADVSPRGLAAGLGIGGCDE